MTLTVGSLFAGIGGFDLGFERAGFEIRWQVEIDPFCRQVLEKHWPAVKRYDDVRTVGAEIERVDVICGGFPCKQTSVAAAISGRRVGLRGADSGLWREMHRIIREIRPRFCVVENPESNALSQVSRDLAELGYGLSRYRAEARAFGAPHLRRRVLLVADAHCSGLAVDREARPSETSGVSWLASERNPWMQALAGVLRVDDGLPDRMERRKRVEACGNAIVPQVAEWIARRILEAEGAVA